MVGIDAMITRPNGDFAGCQKVKSLYKNIMDS